MCDHCEALNEVLTELTGAKVAAVIMRRTIAQVHGNVAAMEFGEKPVSRIIVANTV
jgi:hypothetical protein